MAKPPKKLPGAYTPDSSSSPTRSPVEDFPESAERLHSGQPGQRTHSTTEDPGAPGPSVPGAPEVQRPTVTIEELPGFREQLRESYIRMISWPADKIDQLQPIGNDTGLFQGPDGKTYAPIVGDGYYWVESKPGGFQVPLPFAPNVPGPFLSRIEGQPLWRVERPDWFPEGGVQTPPTHAAGAMAETTAFIPAQMASTLTPAHDSVEGIRYDRRKRTYVDMEQGTVMVQRHADGSYRQRTSSERVASGSVVEPVPGTKRWRRLEDRPQDLPGLINRTRRDEVDLESEETHRFTQTLQNMPSDPLDLSSGLWRNWGKSTRPESGDFVEVNGLYYRIVPQGGQVDVAYLEHPRFSPARYEAFEQMLRDEPSLQPRWARKTNNQWEVLEIRLPFDRSITHSVAARSKYLSDITVEAIARSVFDRASQSGVINGLGLSVLNQTMRFWGRISGTRSPRRDLADPFMMLPIQAAQPDAGAPAGLLTLPTSTPDAFQRMDFDPRKMPGPWNNFQANPNDSALNTLFQNLLRENGYEIHPSPRLLNENAMVFYRRELDAVFVLKLPLVNGNTIARYTRPGSEASSSAFQMRFDEGNRARLNEHLARGNIIHLVGGIQHLSPQQKTLFIVREG